LSLPTSASLSDIQIVQNGRVIWRALGAGVLALSLVTSVAMAAAPPGPRLATVELIETKGSEREENASAPFMALATIGASGEQRQRLVRSKLDGGERVIPAPFYGPAWSSDGSSLAFVGFSGKRDSRIHLVAADGSGLHPVPGTKNGTDPVFSADGRTLAFARTRTRSYVDVKHITEPGKDRSFFYSSTTTWIVDLQGGKPLRLTRWRNGLSNVPDFFTPDGSMLALDKDDDNLDGDRVVLFDLAGGGSRDLLQRAEEAAISPDGSRIAFVGYLHPDVVEAEEDRDYLAGELYVANADGTGVRRVTQTDDVIESSPSWDPSGQRIAYVRVRADTSFVPALGLLFPTGNALMQVNADGTCPSRISSLRKVAHYGVAWQPGPGREAGPIAC
jgi:dipeptidyl aminopeptidase/acylaminoacyl peptidase